MSQNFCERVWTKFLGKKSHSGIRNQKLGKVKKFYVGAVWKFFLSKGQNTAPVLIGLMN